MPANLDDVEPIRELPISLDELYFLFMQARKQADGPLGNDFTERLTEGLFGLWSYWENRTNDTSRFMLKIKK